ncbi:hypothetical protein [Massilia sp. GCM10023247]|uniref:hypothetical protein n=1 Tax=Massilia sp. GCM10023247 TaxID=3252643 RepID=UPI00361597CA
MPGIFLLIALLLFLVAAVLRFSGERKLLNFVEYGPAQPVARINRHAAVRLLLPVCVNLGCAWIASVRPQLAVPLLFLTPLSLLAAVVWIAAGVNRLAVRSP